jgi:hypothetical protein
MELPHVNINASVLSAKSVTGPTYVSTINAGRVVRNATVPAYANTIVCVVTAKCAMGVPFANITKDAACAYFVMGPHCAGNTTTEQQRKDTVSNAVENTFAVSAEYQLYTNQMVFVPTARHQKNEQNPRSMQWGPNF